MDSPFLLTVVERDLVAAKATLTTRVANVRRLRQQVRNAEALVTLGQKAVNRFAKRKSRLLEKGSR
jgi:hypothetical protein